MYICDFEIHAVPQEDIPGKCKPLLLYYILICKEKHVTVQKLKEYQSHAASINLWHVSVLL